MNTDPLVSNEDSLHLQFHDRPVIHMLHFAVSSLVISLQLDRDT